MWQVIVGKVPSKSNSYKIITKMGKDGRYHGSLAKTEALTKYEEIFAWQCNKYRNKFYKKHFKFIVDVFYPSMRSDLDNSLKIILDCLEQVKAIKNDNMCATIVANKYVDKKNPRVEFEIEEL